MDPKYLGCVWEVLGSAKGHNRVEGQVPGSKGILPNGSGQEHVLIPLLQCRATSTSVRRSQ